MNKRQRKKRAKIIESRCKYFRNSLWLSGRGNGKTLFLKTINKLCTQKRHRPFKIFKETIFDRKRVIPGRVLRPLVTEGKRAKAIIFDEIHN